MMVTRRHFAVGAGLFASMAGATRVAGAPTEWSDDLARELARLNAKSAGRLGVAVLDTGTGKRIGHRSDERFPMCSTFKTLACAAVLARFDAGHEDLNRRIRFKASDIVTYSPITKERVDGPGMTVGELCSAAMTLSDNTAANLILASLGGPPAVTAYVRSLGDPVTRLDRTEGSLNEATPGDPRDTTTPDAMASNLRALAVGNALSQRSRGRLTRWMVSNQTGDAKLRAGVPKTWRIGDKTGSGGHGTTNDVAVVWPPGHAPLIVCVYLTETKASSDECNATFAAVG